jgi:acyl carrier protein
MTEAEAKAIIDDIICKILIIEKNQINDKVSRKDLEVWDSMTHLVLVSELEETFNIFFSDEEVVEMKTIGDIKKTLIKHGIMPPS